MLFGSVNVDDLSSTSKHCPCNAAELMLIGFWKRVSQGILSTKIMKIEQLFRHSPALSQ